MKIAFVYDAIHPWEIGGIQRRVWELASRLKTDHEVHVYGQQYWSGDAVRERDGVILHGVCPPKEFYAGDRRSITQALYFSTHLLKPLLSSSYDVIDCQVFPYFPCYVSELASLLNDSALVFTWYEVWKDYWTEYMGRMGVVGKHVERTIAKLPATHVATSETTKAGLQSLGVRDGHLSPLAADVDSIQKTARRDEEIDFLFSGRLIPEKNAELFVRATKHLVDRGMEVQSVLIGEGPERDHIENLVRALDLEEHLQVLDFVERDDYIGYMKAADVFVFPSQREGFGIVGIEALACGTPVVTTNHPQNAAQELVSHGESGYLSDLCPSELASYMMKAKSIPPERCTARARAYDWDQITSEIEALYRSLTAAQSAASAGEQTIK